MQAANGERKTERGKDKGSGPRPGRERLAGTVLGTAQGDRRKRGAIPCILISTTALPSPGEGGGGRQVACAQIHTMRGPQ